MDWASRRKIIYASATFVFVVAVLMYQWRNVLFPDPTCFDQKQNGYESGIDCGGVCSLRCEAEVSPVAVEWVRALKTGNNSYDFVGMLSNKNINSAPITLSYIFVALDKNGGVLKMEFGSTTSLVSSSFPVIKTNVLLPQPPASVLLRLTPGPYHATSENPISPLVRTGNFVYEAGNISRVSVTVTNTTRNIYLKLPIRMVGYDENDNVVATGESILPMLDKEEVQEVVFTWHTPLPTTPTKWRAYPIISPFRVNQ